MAHPTSKKTTLLFIDSTRTTKVREKIVTLEDVILDLKVGDEFTLTPGKKQGGYPRPGKYQVKNVKRVVLTNFDTTGVQYNYELLKLHG